MSWRDEARSVVSRVVLEVGFDDLGKLARAMFDAYPFGLRRQTPYKIWLQEVHKGTYGRLKRNRPAPSVEPLFDGLHGHKRDGAA